LALLALAGRWCFGAAGRAVRRAAACWACMTRFVQPPLKPPRAQLLRG
jgi:hypothetical protein